MEVELDLPNYVTKADSKNTAGADASRIAKKVDLASSKSEVDELDIDKLEKVPAVLNSLKSKVDKLDVDKLLSVPVDLSKLIGVAKNVVVKKGVYNTKIKDIEDKILDVTNLATTNTAFNAKINEVKSKIPSITNRKTKTNELLLIKYIKITKLFVIESTIRYVILYYNINYQYIKNNKKSLIILHHF